MTTDLRTRLDVRYPIIQGPMAGATTPALVAAVSNAGGLGMYGAAYLTPDRITAVVAEIRSLTDRPFGVNLFAGGRETVQGGDPDRLLAILGRHHAELGLDPPELPIPDPDPFPAQLEAILAARVPVFSFTFGIPPPEALAAMKRQDMVVIGTATTVGEALQLQTAGVHAIVAQGSEAGGHRGTFAVPFDAAMIGTMALVPQVVDAVGVPVIASGGIVDGRGIAAAGALGASGVQLGTAFLACPEAAVPPSYRRALREARAEQTAFTRAFSGRPARGIANEFMEAWEGNEDVILPFPLQNAATRPLRNAAAVRDDPRYLSLWAGQAAPLARELPAAALVEQLARESDDAYRVLAHWADQFAAAEEPPDPIPNPTTLPTESGS